jgi:hypothetical protein
LGEEIVENTAEIAGSRLPKPFPMLRCNARISGICAEKLCAARAILTVRRQDSRGMMECRGESCF